MADFESISIGKIRRRKKISPSDVIMKAGVYAFFILFAIVLLYPFLHRLALSFSNHEYMEENNIYIIPHELTLYNYKMTFNRKYILQAFLVSLARTVIGTAIGLGANALLAFILSRKRFIFKSGLTKFWVITMYLQAGFVPVLYLYRVFHLNNSFWVYILPGIVNVLYVIVIRSYMRSIPDSLEESAQLEGAGYMRIFWNIISPVCKPVYTAIALFIAAYHWNSWFDAMVFNRFSREYSTLMYEFEKLLMNASSHTYLYYTVTSAFWILLVLTVIPAAVIIMLFQKNLEAGLIVGSVKE